MRSKTRHHLQVDRLSDAVRLDLGHKGVKAAQQGEGAQPHQVGVVGDEAQRVHHVNDDGRWFRAFLLGWRVDFENIYHICIIFSL